MANLDAPQGFTPTRHLAGGVIRTNEYEIANGSGTSIFFGDAVQLLTNGTITLMANDTKPIGVFAGCEYTDQSTGDVKFLQVWTASTTVKTNSAVKAYVYDDPDIIFSIQCDGTFANTDVGLNSNVTLTPGNTDFGYTKQEITVSTFATTNTLPIRILRLINEPGNAVGANASVEVYINNHQLRANTAGI